MKHSNRIGKIIEKRILQNEDPKLIKAIDDYLSKLEVVWLKWAKAHPNWKESEE